MSDNDWLAVKVNEVIDATNGASNAIKMSPLFTAFNRDDMMARLDIFAQDIGNGVGCLKRLLDIETVEYDAEASGADIVCEELLRVPCENRTRYAFDRAVGAVSNDLHSIRKSAKETGIIPEPMVAQTVMHMSALHNVTRGVQMFYERVPAVMAANFIFR